MNSNDLIYRDCAKEAIRREWESDHDAGVADYQAALEQLPAVPQPMSAVEYAHQKARMCFVYVRPFCRDCPLDSRSEEFGDVCQWFELSHPEDAVAIVEKWAREHPERSEE